MVERGLRITGRTGDPGNPDAGYEFESDLPTQEALAVIEECKELRPEKPPLSDQELREIYEDWVSQWRCLVELGYGPTDPPSADKFVEDWRSPEGPWMPIDGLEYWRWPNAEYEQLKAECKLDFY